MDQREKILRTKMMTDLILGHAGESTKERLGVYMTATARIPLSFRGKAILERAIRAASSSWDQSGVPPPAMIRRQAFALLPVEYRYNPQGPVEFEEAMTLVEGELRQIESGVVEPEPLTAEPDPARPWEAMNPCFWEEHRRRKAGQEESS